MHRKMWPTDEEYRNTEETETKEYTGYWCVHDLWISVAVNPNLVELEGHFWSLSNAKKCPHVFPEIKKTYRIRLASTQNSLGSDACDPTFSLFSIRSQKQWTTSKNDVMIVESEIILQWRILTDYPTNFDFKVSKQTFLTPKFACSVLSSATKAFYSDIVLALNSCQCILILLSWY